MRHAPSHCCCFENCLGSGEIKSVLYISDSNLVPHPLHRASRVLLSQAGETRPPPPPAHPQGWRTEAMPKDEGSRAHQRRHKHRGGDKFSLADSLKARLPKLGRRGLEVLRGFVKGKGDKLPFTFFEEAFPAAAQNIVLEEVSTCLAKKPCGQPCF